MKEITLGERHYRIVANEHSSTWVAHAERSENADPFGIECAGPTEADAMARLVQWMEWQHEHATALESLQQAQRVYHRALAAGAFGGVTGASTSRDLQRESLEAVEAARVRLDEIRARKPE
jgi:hypothetical protein